MHRQTSTPAAKSRPRWQNLVQENGTISRLCITPGAAAGSDYEKEPEFHKNKVSLSPLRTKLDCQLCFLSVRVLHRLQYALQVLSSLGILNLTYALPLYYIDMPGRPT
jgi:hypothetical protein